MNPQEVHSQPVESDPGDASARSIDALIAKVEEHPAAQVNPALLEICRAMGAGLQLNEVLDKILELTMSEMRAHQGSILLLDENHDRLHMLASFGLPDDIVGKGYIARKGSIAEWVMNHDEPLILSDMAEGTDYESLDGNRRIVSSMCVPLRAGGRILGTINLNRTEEGAAPFGREDLDAMLVLTSQAAIYIENSRLHESCLKSERLAAIGQTVAGISHCIKNVLTGLKGGVSLTEIARQNEDWEMLDQSTEILSNSVNRISSLALDMLDYSKDREPDLDTVDLVELLMEIRGVTRQKAIDQKTELVFDLAENARTVRADGHALFRCLLNLIENALHANGEGGEVRVSTELSRAESALRRLAQPKDAAIIIRIEDEGAGIDEELRDKIFEPFFTTKGSKGTGLGLAVTSKIVSEHGGKIEVASPPGKPAVFAIYLPV